MTEPRARPRQKGQVFTTSDLSELLYAYGDNINPLPGTVAVLDEILTDFVIETCHAAALCASYSRRQKIKVDDFRWVLRKNAPLLGRVQEQLVKERYMKSQRKVADFDELGKANAEELAAMAEMGGADAGDLAGGKKGRRKKKRKAEEELDGGGGKRQAS